MATKPKKQSTLEKLITGISSSGKQSVCCSGILGQVTPEIEIAGAGRLRLPMRPKLVRELGNIAVPAPYGKGIATVVDPSVRNTLEIDASKIDLGHSFRDEIDGELDNIASKLGLPPGRLRADLYKLLIYQSGGRFLKHRDSEKHNGMVGSLIVVLPSGFKGGALLVWEKRRLHRFSFGSAQRSEATEYVAFYADCEHEVERIQSGVRVCLAFNLMLKAPRKQTQRSTGEANPALVAALEDRLAASPGNAVVFPLEHQYTQAGLKSSLLKGIDREIVDQLKAAAERTLCQMHFGQMSRHLCQFADDGSFGGYGRHRYSSGPVNYDDLEIGEVYEDDIVIDGWRDSNGKTVPLGDLPCDESMLVCTSPVEQWKPTRRDYEGYTGNAGNTLDRWYHKSAIVLWQESQRFSIVVQMGLKHAIEELLTMRASLTETGEEELEQACDDCQSLAEAIIAAWPERLWGYHRGEPEDQRWLKKFADELPKFDDPDLIAAFLQMVVHRDWTLQVDNLVLTSCRRMKVCVMFPVLRNMMQAELPLNQYGRRAAEGLATRDAQWLEKIASDKKRAGLSKAEVGTLFEIATKKFSKHIEQRSASSNRYDYDPMRKSWKHLMKAAFAVENQDISSRLLALLQTAPDIFDRRTFQVATAKTLVEWTNKRSVDSSTVERWIGELRKYFESTTQTKPSPPTDWTRQSDTECDCRFCTELGGFLTNPNLQKTKIAAREDRRDHLQDVITSHRLDVTFSLDKTTRPYALALSKTTATYERQLAQYHEDLQFRDSLPRSSR